MPPPPFLRQVYKAILKGFSYRSESNVVEVVVEEDVDPVVLEVVDGGNRGGRRSSPQAHVCHHHLQLVL